MFDAMKSKRISMTLDQGTQSELTVIQALQEVSPGRRQHRLRDWLSRGAKILAAKGSSVDYFAASDKTSKTLRVFIHLRSDVEEDKQLLDAVARIAKKSKSRWTKEALILGFQNRTNTDFKSDRIEAVLPIQQKAPTDGNSTHIDIDLDQIAPASPIQQEAPTDTARKESIVMSMVDAQGSGKITPSDLRGLFQQPEPR